MKKYLTVYLFLKYNSSSMWALLIPIVATHLYELIKKRSISRVCFQDLWIASAFALLCFFIPLFLALSLWVVLSSYLFLRWYFLFQYQLPLAFQLFHFLKAPRCFLDSIKTFRVPCCIAILLIASSLTAFLSLPTLLFWVPLFVLSGLLSLATRKKRPRKIGPAGLPILSFPNELYIPISPKYPALRKTTSFLSDKKFEFPRGEKPHVIFLFLESFRAKNVGCLNAQKNSASPHFDALSKNGLFFRNFHANGLQTFRAFISAYFGVPCHHRTVSIKPFCDLSLHGLPQILKTHGYHPAILQSGDLSFDHLYPFFKRHGFETILGGENIPTNKKRQNSWGIDDECMLRFAASFLEKQISPAFLSLFTITNHHPWKSPPGWNFPAAKNLPPIYQNFLQTFAYTDHCLGLFLDLLHQKGLLGKSILFIAGDHGQEMYERRAFSEINHSLYEENIHLPLLILGEKIPSMVIDEPASFIDFLPTVMDLLNIQDVHHGLGRSLIRNGSSPSYFSLQREDMEIGCIQGKEKIIISPNQVLKFNLDLDPEEKNSIASPNDPLITACFDYFQKVEAVQSANAWAPPQDTPFQLKGSDAMNDDEWLTLLHKHPPVSVVDLSFAIRLSDQAIIKTKPEYAAAWHRLTLANVNLTDRSLHWIGKNCPNLMSLNLSHCHLLTDEGIKHLLSQCLELRHLWLDGIEDLSNFVLENTQFNLTTCSLKDVINIQGSSLALLYIHSPHLIEWSAAIKNITNGNFMEMSRHIKQCTRMALSDGRMIQDHALTALISSQPELQEIHLEDFPLLEKPSFIALKKLRYLDLSDCPLLTDAALQSLKNLPLIRIRLQKCPKITKDGLFPFAQKPNLHIFIDECPGISPKTASLLRDQGVHIY